MAFPVVVTSYEIVIADSKHLARYQWNYIVVDEGHRLKNFNCKLLRELRTIPTNNKLLLSGASPALPEIPWSTTAQVHRGVDTAEIAGGQTYLHRMTLWVQGHPCRTT